MDNSVTENRPQEGIDLFLILKRFLPFLRAQWYIPVILALIGAGLMAFYSYYSYHPMYKSEAVFSVSAGAALPTDGVSYNYYYDNNAAKQITETFPYLLATDLMKEQLLRVMGTETMGGTISASSIADTNFFVLTATSSVPENAYKLVNAVMEVYPQVTGKVHLSTRMTITQKPILAVAPYNKVSWKKPVAIGGVIGLLLGLGILLLQSMFRKTVLSGDDVSKFSDIPMLTSVQQVTQKVRKSGFVAPLLFTASTQDTTFSESIRELALKVQRSRSDHHNIFMFTSSVPSEGKSSLAVNTALAIAQSGSRVLLVDADLRGPSAKHILSIEKESTGLGEWLKDGGNSPIRVQRYQNTSLYLYASSHAIKNPTPLLDRTRLSAFFHTVHSQFDYVIVDTPPTVMMSDAALISAHVDRVVYVICEDFATVHQVQSGIESLQDTNAEVIGYVLNKSGKAHSGKAYGYSKYGYKKYGSKYYSKYYSSYSKSSDSGEKEE